MHETVKRYMHLFEALEPGDIAVDCGANVGEITALMARNGSEVHCFEPNPHAFKVLSERFSDTPGVTCHQQAVLDADGEVRLFFHENSDEDEVYWSTGSSTLECKGNVNCDKHVTVPSVDIAAFLSGLEKMPRLLKIDVEGVECVVVGRIIEAGLHEKIGDILVEMHHAKIPEIREECASLAAVLEERGITNIHLDWM